MILPDFAYLQKFGYSDCFYLDGHLWGFLYNGVMPQPIPQAIIEQAYRWKEKEERLAQWPKFSRRRRFEFWRDRTLHNIKLKFWPVEAYSPFGNVILPYKKALILGNAFMVNSEIEGSDRMLVEADDSDYWIIANCDVELAEAISQKIGCHARLFYALSSHRFWVYFKNDRKLILGAIENEESYWNKVKNVFGSFSKEFYILLFLMIVSMILISQLPPDFGIIINILIIVLYTLFPVSILRNIKRYLEKL